MLANPLLVVAIAVAGLVFGNEAARGQLSHQLAGVVREQAGRALEALIDNAHAPSTGAEFAQVYATRLRRRIEPTKNAMRIDEGTAEREDSSAWRVSKSSS